MTVEPSKDVADVNSSTEFINNNVLMASIAVPEFRHWALRISIDTRLFPGPSRFADASRPPKNVNRFDDCSRFSVVSTDASEGPVMTNDDIWRDIIQLPSFCVLQYSSPILTVIPPERFSSKLELRVGDSGFFFPNVLVSGVRAAGLGVAIWSENSLNGGQALLAGEGRQKLPVEVSSGVTLLQLAPQIHNSRRQVWQKFMVWDRQKPVACFLH